MWRPKLKDPLRIHASCTRQKVVTNYSLCVRIEPKFWIILSEVNVSLTIRPTDGWWSYIYLILWIELSFIYNHAFLNYNFFHLYIYTLFHSLYELKKHHAWPHYFSLFIHSFKRVKPLCSQVDHQILLYINPEKHDKNKNK